MIRRPPRSTRTDTLLPDTTRSRSVVAGNVETSQVVTDALYGALGVMAAAQGTMNNTTFGNARHQYYETVCGGAGAGPDFDGASDVHTHMTNSRLTDPEVLGWGQGGRRGGKELVGKCKTGGWPIHDKKKKKT